MTYYPRWNMLEAFIKNNNKYNLNYHNIMETLTCWPEQVMSNPHTPSVILKKLYTHYSFLLNNRHDHLPPIKYIPTLIISSQDITLIFHTENIPIHTHLHFRLYTESTTHTPALKHIADLSTRSRPLSAAHSLSR